MTRQACLTLFLVALLGALVLAACASDNLEPTPTPAASDSPEALLQQRCTSCHSLQRVQSAHKTPAEWTKTVRRMVNSGAQLSDAEFAALVAFLAATYK